RLNVFSSYLTISKGRHMPEGSLDWLIVFDITYVVAMILTAIRIIWDTTSTHKTLAYLLLVIFIPVLGILFYFSFGVNYRKRRVYSKKLIQDDALRKEVIRGIIAQTELNLLNDSHAIGDARSLVQLLLTDSTSPLT